MSIPTYTLPGLPSDLLDSEKPGERRLKVAAEISAPEFPDEYPLPDAQVEALQGLTDQQLRSEPVRALALTPLVPSEYDDIALEYSQELLSQVIYRSEGVVVATLNLTYTGNFLSRIERV